MLFFILFGISGLALIVNYILYKCKIIKDWLGLLFLFLVVIFFVSGIMSFLCANFYWNKDAIIQEMQDVRNMYASQLQAYEENRNNKVVDSDIYYELRKDIIKFNYKINTANSHQGHWWSEFLIWEPQYLGLEPIDMI